jgi:hypothetical protein
MNMNFLKTYGAHLLSYIVSGLTLVAGLNPALLPPQIGVWVGAAGLLLTGIHNVQAANTPAPGSVTTAAKAVMLALLLGVLAVGVGSGVSACKTLPSATVQAGIDAGIDVAVGLAVQQGSTDAAVWKARAVSFKAIATTLQTVNNSGTTTLATLSADLQPLIAKLGPTDVIAANALVAALTPILNQQIAANPGVANVQTEIADVLTNVINACAAYGA